MTDCWSESNMKIHSSFSFGARNTFFPHNSWWLTNPIENDFAQYVRYLLALAGGIHTILIKPPEKFDISQYTWVFKYRSVVTVLDSMTVTDGI